MARIDGVSEKKAGWFAKLVFWRSKKMLGKVAEPAAVMAHHPGVLASYALTETAFARCTRVPKGLKLLAVLKAATQVGCPF